MNGYYEDRDENYNFYWESAAKAELAYSSMYVQAEGSGGCCRGGAAAEASLNGTFKAIGNQLSLFIDYDTLNADLIQSNGWIEVTDVTINQMIYLTLIQLYQLHPGTR